MTASGRLLPFVEGGLASDALLCLVAFDHRPTQFVTVIVAIVIPSPALQYLSPDRSLHGCPDFESRIR